MSIKLLISLPREALVKLRREYRESGAEFGLTTPGFEKWMTEVKLADLGIIAFKEEPDPPEDDPSWQSVEEFIADNPGLLPDAEEKLRSEK